MEDEDEEEEEEVEQETTLVNTKNNQTELTVNDTNNNSTLEVDDSDEDHSKFISSLGTMNEKERKLQIIKRVHMLKDQFYKNISLNYTQTVLGIKHKAYIDFTFGYWKLKRRFNKTSITLSGNRLAPTFNRALMLPRGYEQDLLNRSEHQLIARVKMFVKLRQDLEKVRNLCYMTVKREKLKKQLFEINQHLFEKQADYIARYSNSLSLNLAQPSSVSAGSSARSGRLRDILQTKSENCVYDYPELWIVNEFKEIQESAAKSSPSKDKNKLANVENLANLSLKSGSELDESNSNKENDLSLASSKKAKTKSERKTSKKLTSHSSTSANTATSNNNKLLTKRIKNKYNLMSRNKKRLQSNNVNSLDQESSKKLKTTTATSTAANKPKLASTDVKLNPTKANGRLSSPLKRLNGEQSDLYDVNKSYDSLDSSDSSNGNRKRRRTDNNNKHGLLGSNASSSESLAKNRIRFSSRINGTSNK